MDAGTCARESVEDGLRNIDTRVQELMNSHYHLRASVTELGDKFDQLQTTMDLMLREFQQSVKGKGVASSPDIPIGSSSPIIHHNSGETGSITLVDEFTLQINGRKIKVASTRKLEEIPRADYRTHYMAVTGAKKLNAPMESEDKMKEVWDSKNSKNGRNSNWTDLKGLNILKLMM